jgi:hypothetical protein
MGDPWTIAVLLVCAGLLWRWRASPARAARAALIAFTVFLALKAVLLAQLLSGPVSATPIERSSRILEARWGSLTDWHVFGRSASGLQQWRVSAWNRPPALMLTVGTERESRLVARSHELETVKNFLAVHELVFAREEPVGAEREVMWSDIRYCWHEAPSADVRCALWFGGVFDAAGRPRMQEVRVGSWIQRRAP